jgi:phage gp29-like protein
MPYLIARTSSQSDADKEAIQSQLENMVADAVAVLSGTAEQNDISVIDTGKTANAQLYAEHIKAADEMISKAIVGQTLTADSGGGSGSYALGKVHAGVREDIVYSDKKIVERTHNQLIRWIYEINFAGADIPKFEMFETDDVDKTLAERDQILSNQGVKFTKSYYIENYGLNEKDFDISEAEPAIPDGQPDADAEEFAEGPDDLERILSQFTDAQLQGQINSILKPVLSFINQSEDYAEIKKHIDKLSPKMSSLEIEDTLAKILVLSETIGRFNVKKKA